MQPSLSCNLTVTIETYKKCKKEANLMKYKAVSLMILGLALLVGVATVVAGCPIKGVKELTGAGATFPYPLYSKLFHDYNTVCGVKVNYQSIASGGVIQQPKEHIVDFGASDCIMDEKQRSEA